MERTPSNFSRGDQWICACRLGHGAHGQPRTHRQGPQHLRSAVRELPIIMITAHTDEKRVFAARDADVTEFLTKPITADRLYSGI